MARDLREFLETVKRAGPEFYVEVKRPLSPWYEVGVLQHKLAKEGRFPVVYCPKIEGSKLPLVANVFGSYKLLGLALDINAASLTNGNCGEVLRHFLSKQGTRIPPKEVPASQAPVREVVLRAADLDLGVLPIPVHAERNFGRYITAGMTISRHPDTGQPNIGIYGMVCKGKDRLAVMMRPWHHGGRIVERYAELGRPMEVVTIIGHHPAVALGAAPIVPPGTNELELVGGFLGEPLEVTPGLTVGLPVPALAEIALEGVIDPASVDTEGPFVSDGENYYREGARSWTMKVTAISMRRDAIYHDVHPSHQEHRLGVMLGREAKVLDKVRKAVPSVQALHIGPEGHCGKNWVYISLSKRSEDDPALAGLTALRADAAPKVAVVVDDDIDIYDDREVMWAVGTRLKRNLVVSADPNCPAGFQDAGNEDGPGLDLAQRTTKILLDATKPLDKPFRATVTPPKDLWATMKLSDYVE